MPGAVNIREYDWLGTPTVVHLPVGVNTALLILCLHQTRFSVDASNNPLYWERSVCAGKDAVSRKRATDRKPSLIHTMYLA